MRQGKSAASNPGAGWVWSCTPASCRHHVTCPLVRRALACQAPRPRSLLPPMAPTGRSPRSPSARPAVGGDVTVSVHQPGHVWPHGRTAEGRRPGRVAGLPRDEGHRHAGRPEVSPAHHGWIPPRFCAAWKSVLRGRGEEKVRLNQRTFQSEAAGNRVLRPRPGGAGSTRGGVQRDRGSGGWGFRIGLPAFPRHGHRLQHQRPSPRQGRAVT